VRIVRFDANDEILPLAIVAEKSAEAQRAVSTSAEQLQLGRRELLLRRRALQAECHERRRSTGEVDISDAVAEIAADIKTAPAREGRGPYGCYRRYGRYGLAAAQDVEIGRQSGRRERQDHQRT
jgi:hypothetical protein